MRKLMMAERIMYVDSKTPLNCVFTARISGKLSEENFTIALDKIQKKHPLLRSRIDLIEKYPFFVEEKEIEPIPFQIIDRKTDNDWLLESENAWNHIFKNDKKPHAKVVWIRGNNISELLWIIPHCISDGRTGINLMRELIYLLDDPNLELEPYQAFTSVNCFLNKDSKIIKNKLKSSFYFIILNFLLFFQLKNKHRNLGKNYVLHRKLDAVTSKKIIEKCKANEISVHALLCSAFMLAFKEVQGKKAKGKLISPLDVRHFIPEIKQDHIFAFAPTVELSIKKDLNLFENAKQINSDLLEKIEKMEARELLWMGENMHPVVDRMISMLKSSKGSHDVTLSNMGKIDIPSAYKNFTLETIFSLTVAFPWLNSNTLFVTTFNQQMDFTFMSNDNFLPKEEARKIKDKAIELLTS